MLYLYPSKLGTLLDEVGDILFHSFPPKTLIEVQQEVNGESPAVELLIKSTANQSITSSKRLSRRKRKGIIEDDINVKKSPY